MGEIGISRTDFLTIDLWELRAIARGYSRRNAQILDMMRNQSYWMLSATCGKSFSQSTEITDLIHFPWDKKEDIKPLSEEDIQRMHNLINEENSKAEK